MSYMQKCKPHCPSRYSPLKVFCLVKKIFLNFYLATRQLNSQIPRRYDPKFFNKIFIFHAGHSFPAIFV